MFIKNKIKIVAHRGYSARYPENTMLAFREAIKAGADTIEFDIHATKDAHFVINHDYYVNLPGNKRALIGDLKLGQVRKYIKDMPTLKEVLSEFEGQTRFEVEIKLLDSKQISKALRKFRSRKLFRDVEFTSPHISVLSYVKRLYPQAKIGLFLQPYPEWMTPVLGRRLVCEYMELTGFNVAHLPLSIADQELISMLISRRKLVHIANCDDRSSLAKVRKLVGISQISTRDPLLAARFLR